MENTAPNLDSVPQEKSPEPNYVVNGVIIGIIVAFGVIGFLYYKNFYNKPIALNSAGQGAAAYEFQIPFFNRIGSKTTTEVPTKAPTAEPTQATPTVKPTVVPIKVNTKQDLINQQKALDITDMTSVLSDLEKNSKESLQFSQ
jgi:hypothetical protein